MAPPALPGRGRWLARALAWALGSGLLLTGGFALLVLLVAARLALHADTMPGPLQRHAWLTLTTTLLEQALLPLWAATLASYLALARLAPRLDRAWRTLAPGVAVLAALWFAPVGAFRFSVWHPTRIGDVIGTLALCAGGVSAALLLPRLCRSLAPGTFAPPPGPG